MLRQAEPGAVLADVKFEARRTFYRRNLMRVVESRPSVGIPTIAALPWTRSAPDNAIRPRFRRMLVPGTSRRNTHRTGTNLRPCHRRTGTIQHHSKLGASRLDSVRIPSTRRELRATGDRCRLGRVVQQPGLSTSAAAVSGSLMAVEKTLRLESAERFPLFHRDDDGF